MLWQGSPARAPHHEGRHSFGHRHRHLLDHDAAADLDGYVWGVKWQAFFPGARFVPDSARAAEWAASLGIAMNHVEIGTNGHHLTLVFHDLVVEDLPIGFAPYTTGTDGPNAKMPWGPHTGHG